MKTKSFVCSIVSLTNLVFLLVPSISDGAVDPAIVLGNDLETRVKSAVVERAQIEQDLGELNARIAKLKSAKRLDVNDLADVEVHAKGITWALRHETTLTPADLVLLKIAVEHDQSRLTAMERGIRPWAEKKGKVVRGYVSAVDGSVQPYGVIVPAKFDGAKPIRLDVVLHGSTKPTGMSELRFMSRFDESGDAPDQDFIELHPLGRVENGYRWAGETDVFEAIEDVCRKYPIDRDRVVLRGMSMGASGTWHLGLKHPDRFVALGPYCGYVDTHQFSETPLATFVKVGKLPSHQEKGLHMLDSVDYAANAGIVPAIACMGEKDVFFQAHVIMGDAMAAEGLTVVNLISPGTGHVIDPVTFKEQMKRIEPYASKGIDHAPKHIRFVTWTLKYNRCHWVEILGLTEHYARAELDVRTHDDGLVEIAEPKNVTSFAISPPVAKAETLRVTVGGKPVDLKLSRLKIPHKTGDRITLVKGNGQWHRVLVRTHFDWQKTPGVQGPIDDAFTTPFLCVRGTGTPWNPLVKRWSDANLDRFAAEWTRYFRGELRVKNDTEVAPEDLKKYNLILFGDPGSNLWIGKVLGHPLSRLTARWTREECVIGDGTVKASAADHAVKLICANPLSPDRYVVLNSGHTFGGKELGSLNYLLFPRLGDWAMVRLTDDPRRDEVVQAGFFDERWRLPAADAAP